MYGNSSINSAFYVFFCFFFFKYYYKKLKNYFSKNIFFIILINWFLINCFLFATTVAKLLCVCVCILRFIFSTCNKFQKKLEKY